MNNQENKQNAPCKHHIPNIFKARKINCFHHWQLANSHAKPHKMRPKLWDLPLTSWVQIEPTRYITDAVAKICLATWTRAVDRTSDSVRSNKYWQQCWINGKLFNMNKHCLLWISQSPVGGPSQWMSPTCNRSSLQRNLRLTNRPNTMGIF